MALEHGGGGGPAEEPVLTPAMSHKKRDKRALSPPQVSARVLLLWLRGGRCVSYSLHPMARCVPRLDGAQQCGTVTHATPLQGVPGSHPPLGRSLSCRARGQLALAPPPPRGGICLLLQAQTDHQLLHPAVTNLQAARKGQRLVPGQMSQV